MNYPFLKRFLITLFLFLLWQTPVSADNVNLVINPSVMKVATKPGVNTVVRFSLENKGDPALVKLGILPFQGSDSFGHVELEKELKGPISFEIQGDSISTNEPFLLKSNARQSINLQINVSGETLLKDYYYTLTAETTPFPGVEGESTLRFASRIGAHLLISATDTGKLEKNPSIPLFTIPKSGFHFADSFESTAEIPVILMVKNDGRNVIKTNSTITISGWNTKKTVALEPENILSGAQRLITAEDICETKCAKGITTLLKGIFVGRYQLIASVNSGTGTPSIVAATSFVAIPYKFIGIAAIFLLLFLKIKKPLKQE
ncbi:MAG: hypothetical protein ABIO02_01085 [Patescibacteria group bacterium]